MIKRQVHAYKHNEINTASRLRLIIMMYDGVIRYMEEYKKRLEAGDIAGRGIYLAKAQSVISELQQSLNKKQGGEVSQNLENLYNFINGSLTQANIDGNASNVDHSITILRNLRDAWSQVMAAAPKGNGDNLNGSRRVTLHS